MLHVTPKNKNAEHLICQSIGTFFSKKTQNYYNLGKKFSEIFDKGDEVLKSLKNHVENCQECSKTMEELKRKYTAIKEEELKKDLNKAWVKLTEK